MAKQRTAVEIVFVLAGLIAAFLPLAYLASKRLIVGPELQWFWAINTWSEALKGPMLVITQLGSVAMALVALVVVLWRRGRLLALQLAVTGGATYVVVSIAKWFVQRPRPDEYLYGVAVRSVETGMGFPSGHTAMATAVSVFLAWRLGGWWRCVPFVWIPLVALSRIYLGVHMPLDVIGGALVGLSVVLLQELFKKQITRYLKKPKAVKSVP